MPQPQQEVLPPILGILSKPRLSFVEQLRAEKRLESMMSNHLAALSLLHDLYQQSDVLPRRPSWSPSNLLIRRKGQRPR